MKSFVTIIAIIGFAGVMLFGAFLMVHSGNAASHASCLPTLIGSNECKTSVSPIEYVRVHLGALTELTNGIPAFGVTAAFAIFIILLSAVSVFGSHRPLLAPQEYSPSPCESIRQIVQEKFLKWFAIHEKRDPSLVFAAST